ncbi:hypothetical protein H9P43_010003 [Blastocladiella emersonii ATCC 22665]|nr:hypothetical protein H9P43_010003 [Blastocladiella emersonii ATCC 22665]
MATAVRVGPPPLGRPAPAANMTLNHFILRSQALALYRNYLRHLKPLQDRGTRDEMRKWIRGEFERTRFETDTEKIRTLIANGRTELKRVVALVGLSVA